MNDEDTNIHLNSRYTVLAKFRGSSDLGVFFDQPTLYKSKPTDEDYRQGFFDRFFVRKSTSSEFPIYEVDAIQFQELRNNPFYLSTFFSWKLTGNIETVESDDDRIPGVRDYNLANILRARSFIPGIDTYIKNLLEFHRQI